MRFSTNGGSSYDATSYAGVQLTNASVGVTGFPTAIILTGTVGNLAVGGADLEITLLNQAATGLYPRVFFQCVHMDNTAVTPVPSISYGIGARQVAQDTDAVQFFFSGGNIAAGNYAVYGLA
jgi:hypothetical protein